MIKNLLFKRLKEKESLNEELELATRRQIVENEYFKIFIKNCKNELKETGKCICFNLEQLNSLLNYYGSNNLYYEEIDYYYIIKPKRYVITKLNGKEYRKPITSIIDLREVVLRYE